MKRFILLIAGACALHAAVPSAIAIRNARVVPVSSAEIPRGNVVVRDGRIEAVGANVPIPADAWIIEGEGLTVYPGLIDALSSVGLPEPAPATAAGRGAAAATPAVTAPIAVTIQPAPPPARGPEDRPNTSSWVRAADLVKPTERRVEAERNAGFTTAMTFPMHGIFAGQGAIVDLAGETGGQMVVVPNIGQYVTFTSNGFTGGYPGALLGVIAYIRQIYIDADYYQKAKAAYQANPRAAARPAYDRALEGVLESPRILIPVNRRIDIDRMLRFSAEMKLHPIFYGPVEGYRSADLLAKSNVPVLLNLRWPEKARDANPDIVETLRTLENRANAPSSAAIFAKNGIKFAFYTGGLDRRSDIIRGVKRAIDAGLPADAAVRALTLSAAEIYGVDDRLGSIDKGKIANLVVTKGDIFESGSEVKYVFVDGVKFEPGPEEPPAFPGRSGAPTSRTQPGEDQ